MSLLDLSSVASPDPQPVPFLLSVNSATGVIHVYGELDRANAHRLPESLGALAGTSHRVWAVDASGITFCDTAGLRALVEAQAIARRSGRDWRLLRASRCVRRLVRLAGLEPLLDTPASAAADEDPGGWRAGPGSRPPRRPGLQPVGPGRVPGP